MADQPVGLVGISCAEVGRYSVFYDACFALACPAGTVVKQARGANIAENRNNLTRYAIDLGVEWVLFLDDDGILPPDALTRLLSRGRDVVSALYLQRHPPFHPQAFDREDDRGRVRPRVLAAGDRGVVKVVATGGGCLLVKRKVLEAVGTPWWTLGQIEPDAWGDDIDFCRRVRKAGFDVHCDLDTAIGHMCNATLWPVRQADGTWLTTLVQKEPIATWPAAHRPDAILIAR